MLPYRRPLASLAVLWNQMIYLFSIIWGQYKIVVSYISYTFEWWKTMN